VRVRSVHDYESLHIVLFDGVVQLGGGGAGSWALANYGPRMLARNFDPGFYVEHFIKVFGPLFRLCIC
jgi:3-hydroxyisobutyrate dehydrogenase-like beta-hydroxyacid dehydrogenase